MKPKNYRYLLRRLFSSYRGLPFGNIYSKTAPKFLSLKLSIFLVLIITGCQNNVGPAITHEEFSTAGLGGPTVPTFWNTPATPQVGQIFQRLQDDDGSVSFTSYTNDIATAAKTMGLVVTDPHASDYSNTVSSGPSLDVVLAYMGAQAEAKAQYVRAVTVSATDTHIEEIHNQDRFLNLLNSTDKYPTYIARIQKDNQTRQKGKLSPTSASYWIVTKVLYSKNFTFGVERTRGGTLTAGDTGADITGKIADAVKTGGLPQVKVTASLNDNDHGVISGKSDIPYPIFVQIKPLLTDKDGDILIDLTSKNPPFAESTR